MVKSRLVVIRDAPGFQSQRVVFDGSRFQRPGHYGFPQYAQVTADCREGPTSHIRPMPNTMPTPRIEGFVRSVSGHECFLKSEPSAIHLTICIYNQKEANTSWYQWSEGGSAER